MFSLLFAKYQVKLQAYHGGCMTGKDIQKVMENAHEIFPSFAVILKNNKKEGGMDDTQIDELCETTRRLFVLWDGAFSFASTINPTQSDINAYNEYVSAAVLCHAEYGCSITPKVHLMHKHAGPQMKLPGGLGQKREDWVEHQHQISKRLRENYKRTVNKKQRAISMACAMYRDSDPKVKQERDQVIASSARGQRQNTTYRDEERREKRLEAREEALYQWTSRFD